MCFPPQKYARIARYILLMNIKPALDSGVECLKAFRLYCQGKRTTLNEAVEVGGAELRLSQAWCHFEVDDTTDIVHRRLLGIDPKHPHMDAENVPDLEDLISGLAVGTNFWLPLTGGGYSLLAWRTYSMFSDSPHADGLAYRQQINDFKIVDFIRSAELKPGEEFITDTRLVIGFIIPRSTAEAVQVKFHGKLQWLLPVEVPVCFIPGCLMKSVDPDEAGENAKNAMRHFSEGRQRELNLKKDAGLVMAIIGAGGASSIVRETKVFTTEYFDFLVNLDSRRELWKATEPDLDAVEDFHHGDIPVLASNF